MILYSPNALSSQRMEIKSADFVLSTAKLSGCPRQFLPEYALIGRSNVGKSSLINMLCNKAGLAKTSSTPGKTVSMNYFKINNNWFMVDLPGYGYARRSKSLRNEWQATLTQYLQNREQLQCLLVLVDSRISPQDIDLEFINYLGEKAIPFVIVFTKLDKLKANEAEKNIETFCEEMLKSWQELPQMFRTSAIEKTGREELLRFIYRINKEFNTANS